MSTNRKTSKEKVTKSKAQPEKASVKKPLKKVTIEELMSGLFVSKPPKNTKSLKKTVLYTIIGSGKSDDDGNVVTDEIKNAYAKSVLDGKKTVYYILSNGQSLFDPTDKDSRNPSKDKIINGWNWTKVSHSVFIYYLGFLRTKKRSQLTNAEREFYG